MAAEHIPRIHVIQDTPTRHGPAHTYLSPTTSSRSPERSSMSETAPEVDLSHRDAEGLQVDPSGTYPQPTTSQPKRPYFAGSSQKEALSKHEDGSGLIPIKEKQTQRSGPRICGLKKRTFILTVIVIIVVLVGAIGGGVGGFYASKAKNNSEPSYVTSGTTGMAKLPCKPATATAPGAPAATPRDLDQPYLALGATFNITCRRGVPGDAKTKAGRPIDTIARFTEYTFKACMDRCAQDSKCSGVTYGANLTATLTDGDPGGNCLIKNGTWDASAKREMWFASAVKE